MIAAHLRGMAKVKNVFAWNDSFYTHSKAMPLGNIDCSACLHATLFFPNLFAYTPNIVWCRFNFFHSQVNIINGTTYMMIIYHLSSNRFQNEVAVENKKEFYSKDGPTTISATVLLEKERASEETFPLWKVISMAGGWWRMNHGWWLIMACTTMITIRFSACIF